MNYGNREFAQDMRALESCVRRVRESWPAVEATNACRGAISILEALLELAPVAESARRSTAP